MIWIAQGSSGSSDFFSQVAPLLVTTTILMIVWISTTILAVQRAAERRRRNREGLENLPSIFTQIRQWIARLNQSDDTPTPPPTAQPSPAPAESDVSKPPSDDLVDDLPSPDLALLMGDEEDIESEDDPLLDENFVDFEETEAPPDEELPSANAPASLPPTAASRAVSFAPPPSPPPSRSGIPDDAVEIMTLWRNLDDGKLVIDMRGVVFQDLDTLNNPKIQRRFQNILVELLVIAREEHLLARFANPKASPTDAPPSHSATSSYALSPPPTPAPPASSSDAAPSIGIAGQIEAFLQGRLAVHPQLQGRNIHIHPAEDGGVLIEVDTQYYEAVGDIIDPQVRAFLQQTMADWSSN